VSWDRRSRWLVATPPVEAVAVLERELGVSSLLARLLANRGMTEPATAAAFLDARLSQHLRSPMLFRDMPKAADRVLAALDGGEKIGICGDYDVDGVSGCAILVRFLRELGTEAVVEIPNRERDGYGLSERGVRRLADEGVNLMLTVDCGGVSHQEIALATDLGMDVVVCDHHEVSDTPLKGALAVLNPVAPDAGFPFTGLCGAGVAFYLALGVRMRLREKTGAAGPDLRRCLDLVALGTVADIVPLLEENRVLVKYGIEELARSQHPGIVALKAVSGVTKVSSGAIGFRLAPRLNAGGRLGDATAAVELLTTENATRAEEISVFLDEQNRNRQAIERRILNEAMEMVRNAGDVDSQRSIVLASTDWHPGVIGIVASRLVERYHRPTILIAVDGEGGLGRGSARSISGLDIHDAIRGCEDTLEGFGGHRMAAGLSIRADNVSSFAERFETAVAERTTPEHFVRVVNVDCEVPLRAVDRQCVEDLARLEPHGMANAQPVMLSRGVCVRNRRTVGESHLKLDVEQDGAALPAIAFGMSGLPVEKGSVVDVLYTPMLSEWRGRRTLELRVRDLQPH